MKQATTAASRLEMHKNLRSAGTAAVAPYQLRTARHSLRTDKVLPPNERITELSGPTLKRKSPLSLTSLAALKAHCTDIDEKRISWPMAK